MQNRASLIVPAAVLLVAGLWVGCAAPPEDAEHAAPGLSRVEAERALGLYQGQACTICHGARGEGVGEAGPALDRLEGYWDAERLARYLAGPEEFAAAEPEFARRRQETYRLDMPAFDHLSQDERDLLARWLLSRSGR